VTVATTARLDFCGDADAFDLRLDLEIRDGDETPWRRSRRRRILRRLG
jgi:hypothetical protein